MFPSPSNQTSGPHIRPCTSLPRRVNVAVRPSWPWASALSEQLCYHSYETFSGEYLESVSGLAVAGTQMLDLLAQNHTTDIANPLQGAIMLLSAAPPVKALIHALQSVHFHKPTPSGNSITRSVRSSCHTCDPN